MCCVVTPSVSMAARFLCLLSAWVCCHAHTGGGGVVLRYEWVSGEEVFPFAQDSAVSLLAFRVPVRTEKAQVHVTLSDDSGHDVTRTVILAMRREGIPVVQPYNETVPERFVLPSDQQTHLLRCGHNGSASHSYALAAPTSGRLYLLASVLNPLEDVVEYLRWGQEMGGSLTMKVKVVYSVRPVVQTIYSGFPTTVLVKAGQPNIFSFMVPASTTTFSLILTNCSSVNGSDCPVTMTTSESLSAADPSAHAVDCKGKEHSCRLEIISPRAQSQHFVKFSLNDVQGLENATFHVNLDVEGCSAMPPSYTGHQHREGSVVPLAEYRRWNQDIGEDMDVDQDSGEDMDVDQDSGEDMDVEPVCVDLGALSRVSVPDESDDSTFTAYFGDATEAGEVEPKVHVVVPDFRTEVRTFVMQDYVDTGGLLSISAILPTSNWTGVVWVCAMAQRVAHNGSLAECRGGALLSLSATGNLTVTGSDDGGVRDTRYLPFPSSGTWYLALQSQCWGNRGPDSCSLLPVVTLVVGMVQCAPNNCGQFGSCQEYIEATTVFASCECHAGYRGLTCEDATYALSERAQKTAVYLLVLSNLAFVPAILLAAHRRFFTLAAVFCFNCFFSTFYHACDTSRVFQLCIMSYDALSFGDFFGSVLSFYCLLLTMARAPHALRSCVLTAGTMVIAVLMVNDRHNDAAHIAPLAAAGVILVTSWARRMRLRRALFPSRRRYVLYLLPGVALAVTGIGVNYGLMWRQSTYQYTHSAWHLALMLSPCLLMPPRQRGHTGCTKGSSATAQDIIRNRHHHRPVQQHRDDDGDGDDEPALVDAGASGSHSDENRLI